MAWTVPLTFVSGTTLTAAQLNILGSDLLETAPAKASAVGQYFVATGVNQIAARLPAQQTITTAETTTSGAFTDLATVGPAATITCVTGAYCLALVNSLCQNNTVGAVSTVGFDISGATTLAAANSYISFTSAVAGQAATLGGCRTVIGMTGGSNTFTQKYTVSAGTGTFSRRHLTVLALG